LISWDIEELNGNSQEDMNKVIRAIAGKVRELVNVV
jgi:hypothetical protein